MRNGGLRLPLPLKITAPDGVTCRRSRRCANGGVSRHFIAREGDVSFTAGGTGRAACVSGKRVMSSAGLASPPEAYQSVESPAVKQL